MEKVHNFLYPQEGPQDVLDFFEFEKKWKFDDPPRPLGPNLGKFWNWENFEISEPPLQKINI